MRVTTDDGIDIAVHHLGGSGPPLVLAHATGFHGRVWEPVAARLAGEFTSIAFDERGHGDSGRPQGRDFDWHGFARDVLAVVDGLGLADPLGAGHSCGGAALLLAEQARPGTFSRLYCFEPIVFPVDPPPGPNPGNPLSEGARRRRANFPSRQAAFDNYRGKPPFSTLHPDALWAYVEHGLRDAGDGSVALKCAREDEAAVYAMGSAHDAFARLDDVKCPVTLACGEHTDAIGPRILEILAGRLPDAAVDVLPGLGHFGPLQDPGAVAASMRRALCP